MTKGFMVAIYIHCQSRLIGAAFQSLLEKVGFEVLTETAQLPCAQLAIWDLRNFRAPYPPPPELPTLALTTGTEADKLLLVNLGYKGYLIGQESPRDLERAIRRVLAGEIWAERSILSKLIRRPKASPLTGREQQVLSLIVQGLTNKQIAQRLGLAEKTVKVYVSGVLDKLEAKGRIELVLGHRQLSRFSDVPS